MIVKKLLFGLLFLIAFWFTFTFATSLFIGTDILFSLSLHTLFTIVTAVALIALSSILFTLFVSLAQEWALILPIIILASLIPLISLSASPTLTLATHRIVVTLGMLIALPVATLLIQKKMKNYLTFQPTILLGSTTKTLAQVLLILFSIAYFVTINAQITQNGFEIPSSLLDTAVSMVSPSQLQGSDTQMMTQEQLNQLRKSPQQLSQSLDQLGLDAKAKADVENIIRTGSVDQVNKEIIQLELTNVKTQVRDQVDNAMKPYVHYIPPIMAFLFYFSLAFFLIIALLFVSPLIWLTFLILEKTGFVHFTTEMREVKKMVV